MQLKSMWAFVKRNPKKSIVLPTLFYLCMSFLTYINLDELLNPKSDCDEATKILGGGTRQYGGQDYKITLCGTFNNGRFSDGISNIRLQVHDAQNELWVERYFDQNIEMIDPIAYTDTSFIYFDISKDRPAKLKHEVNSDGVKVITFDESDVDDTRITVSMPPSRWEWLKVHAKYSLWKAMGVIFVTPLKWLFSL